MARAETCIQLDRVQASDDNIDMLIAPTAITVQAVACHCDGVCSAALATLAFSDRAGNGILLDAALVCSTGTGLSTWVTANTGDPDRNLILGEGLEVSVSNSSLGSTDLYTVCVRFS